MIAGRKNRRALRIAALVAAAGPVVALVTACSAPGGTAGARDAAPGTLRPGWLPGPGRAAGPGGGRAGRGERGDRGAVRPLHRRVRRPRGGRARKAPDSPAAASPPARPPAPPWRPGPTG